MFSELSLSSYYLTALYLPVQIETGETDPLQLKTDETEVYLAIIICIQSILIIDHIVVAD